MSPEEVKDRINETLLNENNPPFKNYEELTKVLNNYPIPLNDYENEMFTMDELLSGVSNIERSKK